MYMDPDNIMWVAPEYEHHNHGADWYWAMGIITVSLAIAFVIVDNLLLSIIILLGMGTLLYYAKRGPRIIEFKISKSGILADKTLYSWKSLNSFFILEKEEGTKDYHEPKIMLISKKPFMTHIIIPINEYILEEVHATLAHMLPEVPHTEPLAERVARKLGF